MATRPESLPCPECAGTAVVQLSAGFATLIRGREWDWHSQRGKGLCIPNADRFKRSDDEQYALHRRGIEARKQRARQLKRGFGKSRDVRYIGHTPIEVHEGVVEATGDKEIWQKDTENLLKKTGCWLGDD